MKVGLFADPSGKHSGGGHTFVETVFEEVLSYSGRHNLVPIFRSRDTCIETNSASAIVLQDYRNESPVPAPLRRRVVQKIRARLVSSTQSMEPGMQVVGGRSLLDRVLLVGGFDMVWFLTPWSYWNVSVPFMYTVWDLQHREQPYFPEVSTSGWDWQARERVYSAALPRAARIVTGTATGKEQIVHYYRVNPANIEVVPFPATGLTKVSGTNGDALKRKYGLRRKFALYPAIFWPHKNHVNLLLAWTILRERRRVEIDLVFVGSDAGNESLVRRRVEEMGLSECVHFLGFVPDCDLVALYQNAVMMVFPTFFGPDNLPPLEAFSLGCPVVASSVDGAREQLGEAALLINPRDPRDISEAVERVSLDNTFREGLIEKGIERANLRKSGDFAADIFRVLDEFESVRRCWGNDYVHV